MTGRPRQGVGILVAAITIAMGVSGCADRKTAAIAGPGRSADSVVGGTRSSGLPTPPPVDTSLPMPDVVDRILPRAGGRPISVAPGTPPPCGGFTLLAANFAENGANLLPGAAVALDHVAGLLGGTTGRILVTGHTDPRPASFPGGNQALSQARAQAVHVALLDRGVPATRFVLVEGRADHELIDDGTTEQAYQRNRRVEVALECA